MTNNIRKIIHIDMDAFFAAVHERDEPSLRLKPIAVGGLSEHRGVISTANYVAREFGVKSAIPTATALRLCPDLIIVHPDMAKYKQASNAIRSIFHEYTELVEPLSLDEAFLDVTACMQHSNSATWIAEDIRKKIFQTEQLTASAGVSINKFIAKVASDWNKPNGQYVVPPNAVNNFVVHLPINKIFGVGPKTAIKIHNLGARTCADLQKYSLEKLTENFGKFGKSLYNYCRGIDHRPVEINRVRKSLSVEETYSHDLTASDCLVKGLELLPLLERRLARARVSSFRKIFIKIKFHDFTRTSVEKVINKLDPNIIRELFNTGLQRGGGKNIRLLGIGVRFSDSSESNHSDKQQLQLFV